MRSLILRAPETLPEIRPGETLDAVIAQAFAREDLVARDNDVLVCAQKIISKSENRYIALASVRPGARARELAAQCNKDPRLVELVLSESTEVVRCAPEILIVRHRLGFVVANAGIDQSNIDNGETRALLLPLDPDASAARLRAALQTHFGIRLAVLIADSFGRPWRMGVSGTCIGAAGLDVLLDRRGQRDRFGRVLKVTQIAAGDQLCAAAAQLMGEGSEGTPIALISGVDEACFASPRAASALLRPAGEDLFR